MMRFLTALCVIWLMGTISPWAVYRCQTLDWVTTDASTEQSPCPDDWAAKVWSLAAAVGLILTALAGIQPQHRLYFKPLLPAKINGFPPILPPPRAS